MLQQTSEYILYNIFNKVFFPVLFNVSINAIKKYMQMWCVQQYIWSVFNLFYVQIVEKIKDLLLSKAGVEGKFFFILMCFYVYLLWRIWLET